MSFITTTAYGGFANRNGQADAEDSTSKVSSIWQKISNPLLGLSSFEIDRLLTMARQGMDVRLQAIYALIEEQTPIFSVCLEKRQAGLLQRQWDVVPIDENDKEGVEQSKRIRKMFERSDELSENSLTDAFRRLQQGAFRGRAYVKPFISEDGELSWRPLENWNVLRAFNRNWWNPSANQPACVAFDEASWKRDSGLVEIPKDEICYTLYERPIDVPGVMIYLRQLVGETKWAQFVERHGNPQVILTAPEGTPDSNLGLWNQRAMQIQNGASGVLPNGADVKELTEGRGQDPFSEFVKHQEEVICILAVGGALNTLGGATGLGSNLAEKQDSQFQSLVSLDAKKIQNTVNNIAVKKICRQLLRQDVKCRFHFVEDEDITAEQHIKYATMLRDLGAAVDLAKLKEITQLPYLKLGGNTEEEVWQPQLDDESK